MALENTNIVEFGSMRGEETEIKKRHRRSLRNLPVLFLRSFWNPEVTPTSPEARDAGPAGSNLVQKLFMHVGVGQHKLHGCRSVQTDKIESDTYSINDNIHRERERD